MSRRPFLLLALPLSTAVAAIGILTGTPGDDVFELGSAPGTVLFSGTSYSGIDDIDALEGTDTLVASGAGSSTTMHGPGIGTIDGIVFDSIERLVGGAGLDILIGNTGGERFESDGAAGLWVQDVLFSGLEQARGGSGNDVLIGSRGTDHYEYDALGRLTHGGITFTGLELVDDPDGIDTLTTTTGDDDVIVVPDGLAISPSAGSQPGTTTVITYTGLEFVDLGDGIDGFVGTSDPETYEYDQLGRLTHQTTRYTGLERTNGGGGGDTFVFGPDAWTPEIEGFEVGADVLDVRGLLSGAPPLVAGDDPFALGYLETTPSGDGVLLSWTWTPGTTTTVALLLPAVQALVADPSDPYRILAADTGPTLDLLGACPGTILLDVAGATPQGSVYLLSSSSLGSAAVPAGPCAGTTLGLAGPVRVRVRRDANAVGELSLSPVVGGGACGQHLQALDMSTCQTTPVRTIPVL